MEATAKITGKGQITVPKVVRDALGVRDGDNLLFRVESRRAVVAATADLLDLTGVVPVPAAVRGLTCNEVRRRAWTAHGEEVVGE
jgi:AbrB family looped-hinge helix DNA binding protein